ncbi:MAG: nuclear transport factor 2 family protein [Chloroflexota bacterium]
MLHDPEVHAFLLRHLQAIMSNNLETYHATTAEDLTLYEWYVTPHRLDGLPFHDFMITEGARSGTSLGVGGAQVNTRFDLSNLNIQRYGDTAIACYTLLISTGTLDGVEVIAHNESRVMVKLDGAWKVVHAHKSPAWPAPRQQPH